MVMLEDLMRDPSTREFLREVNRRWGRDWANTLTREIHSKVLVDMGPVENFPQSEVTVDKEVDYEQMELLGCAKSKRAAKLTNPLS